MKRLYFLILLLPLLLACAITQEAITVPTAKPSPTDKPSKPSPTAQALAPRLIACTVTALETLNLREAPGTSAAVIAVLRHGEILTILDDQPVGDWIHVQRGDRTGWINSNYCKGQTP